MDSSIYIKDEHDGAEIRRAIRISTLRLDFDRAVSFLPGGAGTFLADWNNWLDGRWNPFLAGHLVQVYARSRALEVEEIVKLDAALSDFLDADEAERSLAVGAALCEATVNARHHRARKRFHELAGGGEGAGHAATIFAMQAAEYNLPMFSGLISYLYLEWRSGAQALAQRPFVADESQFAVDAIGALGGIRDLLRRHLGDFAPAACA